MRFFLYNLTLYLLSPLVFLYLLFSKRNRGLIRRFRPDLRPCPAGSIWFHACSVGEVGVALTLMEEMKKRFPESFFLMTVSTVSGMKQAEAARSGAQLAWLPFDLSNAMSSFVRHYAPQALILIETEIWPNMIKAMHRRKRPVIVVNGRLSDKHFPRYKKLKKFSPPVFPLLSGICSQEETYTERFEQLGVFPERIETTGNMKYDQRPRMLSSEEKQALQKEVGIGEKDPVVVFGSTHPGDEELAASCWEVLSREIPGLYMIVVPRHLDRLKAAVQPFGKIPFLQRSLIRGKDLPEKSPKVLFVDTMGELTQFYQLASVAVICGSFYPGVEGHNPLEAAVASVPVVFGPHMESFKDAVKLLVAKGGAVEVPRPDTLMPILHGLLDDEEERKEIGRKALEAVQSNEGATLKTADALSRWLTKE
ncbi:MAG: 3-deoxy-D-manno-octulosonic acid transferase [Candidatus Hydrogenedens sp.]|jgi:3-deoxy-D-manno-octulosonic-acid transferase|nr:3-deoxy-D-manno-octulosonic acid transferase [Candidatus Hydrogenedens sp.]